MGRDGHGKRASSSAVSSSHLSPLAQPFSLNPLTPQPQPSWSSLTLVDPCASMPKSLNDGNLEDNLISTASYSCYDHEFDAAMASIFLHDLLDFGEDSHFPQYPSANAGSDFGFMSSALNESLPNYTELSSYGHSQASFSGNKNASLPYEALLEQGKLPVKGSKPYGDNSEGIHEKFGDLTTASTIQVDAGSLSVVNTMATPYKYSMSVACSKSMLQNYSQSQLPYTASAVTWSHCNSGIALCESGSKKVDPYTAKSAMFHSPIQKAFPAAMLQLSDTSTTVSPLNPILSKNVDLKGNCSPDNYDSSSKCSSSGIKDLHHLMSGEGKEIHRDECPNDKEGKEGKPPSGDGIGPLLMAKSDPLITLTNIPDDICLEHLGAKEAVSLSKKLDENDSDVDSPCWKGTLASRKSSFGVSTSLSSESSDFVEIGQEGRNSLNPLAPHFFPQHAKKILSYHANDYAGDDFSSFQKSESSAVNSFSKGHGSVNQTGSRSKSSLLMNGNGTQSSHDIHELQRDYALLDKSESGSVLNLPEGLSKLLSTHSKIDVPTILRVMHDLSELLVQNCSNDFESLNEHKHDLIQNIINNLCMCIQHRAAGPVSDITLTGTPYYPNQSTELHECSNTGFQVTRTKALAAPLPHELYNQNGHEGRKVNSHVFSERILDSFSSCSGVFTEKSNDIIQVMGNALRGNHHRTKEELDPQAAVYKNLWLEAEAALRSMKYETCVLCMNLEINGLKFDDNKVSGKLLTRGTH